MSLDYLITPEARDDIDNAHEWYELQTTGRGDAFLAEVSEMITQLRDTPELCGRVRGEVRAAPLPTSKFILYYRIRQDRIEVLAVQHAAADPQNWQRRV
jgi:plasmid stabilization system protein ParE